MDIDIRFMGDSALVILYDAKQINGGLSTITQDEDRIQRETTGIERDYLYLSRDRPLWITDIVPCFSSIGVYYNPVLINFAEAEDYIRRRLTRQGQPIPAETTMMSIAVRYGGEYGPDLQAVSEALGMTPEEVICEHCLKTYNVWAIGFLPGFPYMGSLSAKIVLPRKETPVRRVAAGSVAIAGYQTGIYPYDSPGGWHIIGRTEMKMFDPERAEPCLLKPGDRVRFVRMGT